LVLSGYLPSRVKFVGVLNFRARGPIHVGHSKEANVLYALKLPNGDLVVPASTWKGVLRSLAERLAPSLPIGEIERLAFETVGRAQAPEEARRNVREKGLMDDFVKVLERKPQTASIKGTSRKSSSASATGRMREGNGRSRTRNGPSYSTSPSTVLLGDSSGT